MIYLIYILCAICSAILYRAGGMGKEVKHWTPVWMRRSWVRDWLCPLFVLLPWALTLGISWWYLLAYLLTAASLSTYWDFLLGYDNFWFSGFMCGLALLPLIFCGIAWWLILIRSIVLALGWGGLCAIAENDFVEEYSRGAMLVIL